jgi:predicted dehydrogenase
MNKLKAAVIGAGFSHSPDGREPFGARAVIPALLTLKDQYELVAVCTAHRETAEESATHFGVKNAYWNHLQLLSETDADVIFIAVQPVLQYDIVMSVLAAGKHVYCEHPTSVSSSQALTIYRLARERKLRTGVGHQDHHAPEVREMRRRIADGFIGTPQFFNMAQFRSNMITPRPSRHAWITRVESGGRPSFRAGHPLERLCTTIGSDIERVLCKMSVLVPERPSTDGGPPLITNQKNNALTLIKLAGDVSGVMHMSSTAWNRTGERLEVYGTDGMLGVTRYAPPDDDDAVQRDYRPYSGFRLFGASKESRQHQPERILPAQDWADALPDPFGVVKAYAAFAEAIQAGREYAPSFLEGLKLHRMFDALEKSYDSKDWETADYSGFN